MRRNDSYLNAANHVFVHHAHRHDPNRNSRPAYLLRESVREGKRVTKRTLANLSALPIEQIEAIRRVLKGEKLGPVGDGLECIASRHHGHVDAMRTAMARLGLDKLIDTKASRSRDLVTAMVAGRIIAPAARHGRHLGRHDFGG